MCLRGPNQYMEYVRFWSSSCVMSIGLSEIFRANEITAMAMAMAMTGTTSSCNGDPLERFVAKIPEAPQSARQKGAGREEMFPFPPGAA